jgi:uncharacterized protein YjbI with pentapeptide repeats
MADLREDKQASKREAEAASTCPELMYSGQPCGRPIYIQSTADDKPVCLMHSLDENKDAAAFRAELEKILQAPGERGIADFSKFVFPHLSFRRWTFTKRCLFRYATFPKTADFPEAMFKAPVDFSLAKFETFAQFANTTFEGDADFAGAGFKRAANFSAARFAKKAEFMGTSFEPGGYFSETKFCGEANFGGAFFEEAMFEKAVFQREVTFCEGSFGRKADFSETVFSQEIDFSSAQFRGQAIFRKTEFPADMETPGPIFSHARFEKAADALFENTRLKQALFHQCDVSQFSFSDVEWRRRENGKCMVFDENVNLKHRAAKGLNSQWAAKDDRNYRLVAELYQQLKKNYDDKRDYWTAGDFHYGEMEMKRLHSQHGNKVVKWLHQNCGLVAWYKYASEYGESYVRPILWLIGIMVLFMFLFPICGLRPSDKPPAPEAATRNSRTVTERQMPELSYANFIRYGSTKPGGQRVNSWSLLGNGLMTTIEVASFQRDLAYEPSYPWGRLLGVLEILLTSTVVALFLLAVRRQFRR